MLWTAAPPRIVANLHSGLRRTDSAVCPRSVRICTITFELNDFLPRYSAAWFTFTVYPVQVKLVGHGRTRGSAESCVMGSNLVNEGKLGERGIGVTMTHAEKQNVVSVQ